MLIAITNQSTMVSNADMETMCKAIQTQMTLHVAPAWSMLSPTVSFYADATKVPGYAWNIVMQDNSTVQGALGYHTEVSDKIDGYIFAGPVLDNKGVVLYDPSNPQNTSVASVLSHEVIEAFADRFCNLYAEGPTVKGSDGNEYTQYAFELADPVESGSYVVNVGTIPVSVSNWIFPSWFNSQATTALNMPFDYMKQLSAPFTMSAGGYIVVQQSGNATQIFGEMMPQWKRNMKNNAFSRMNRRVKNQ